MPLMKPLSFELLRLVADGEFHSGEVLAQQLGVSRASVWQALQPLEQQGLELFKVRGRGYCLSQPFDSLEKEEIFTYLKTSQLLTIHILDSIESTNVFLMQQAGVKNIHGQVAVAELQTEGKGRRGKPWHSGLGTGLTFSLGWQFERGAEFLSGLSLVIGVALVRAFSEYGIKNVSLKWPNDVLHHYRKFAGILTEVSGDALGPSTVVIGIGINIKLSDDIKNKIDQATTDIYSICDQLPKRNQLLAVILNHLSTALSDFSIGGFESFKKEWVQYHAYSDKSVRITLPDGSVEQGMVTGVHGNGALQIQGKNGIQHFNVGEISLKGNV